MTSSDRFRPSPVTRVAVLSTTRKTLPAVGVMVTVAAVSLILIPDKMWGYDPWIMYQVANSIVSDGNFVVHQDALNLNLPYSSYGIGMSLLMVVTEVLSRLAGIPADVPVVFINPILLALLSGVLWATARRSGLTKRQSAAASLIVCLATLLLPASVTAFSEVGTALGVGIGLLGLVKIRAKPWAAGVLIGAGVSLAMLMRTDSAILIAPVFAAGVAVMPAAGQRLKGLAGFACGALPGVMITAAYNYLRFGSPLVTQYQGKSLGSSFSQSFSTGFLGLTVSPGRGILLYTPLVAIMAVAFRWVWQRNPAIATVCVVIVLDRILFYSSWWAWHAGVGWGPRFLVPALPALLPFVVESIRRLPQAKAWLRLAFAMLVAGSFAFGVVGAMTDPSGGKAMALVNSGESWTPAKGDFMVWATTPAAMAAWNEAMFDWPAFPIRDHAREAIYRENIMSGWLRPDSVDPLPLTAFALLAIVGLGSAFWKPASSGQDRDTGVSRAGDRCSQD